MDIICYSYYLILIDCKIIYFFGLVAIGVTVFHECHTYTESIFNQRFSLHELFTDNDRTFSSRAFKEFSAKWDIHLCFWREHTPSRNGSI